MIDNKGKKELVRTFFNYAVPCIIGMLLTSCITVIDGIFIGNKLGGNGLAAVNLTLPVLYLFLGLTIMVGLGGVTIATHSLGAKDFDTANRRFSFTFAINLIVTVFFICVFEIFLDETVSLLNAKGIISYLVKDYLRIIVCFYIFMMTNIIFSMFIRSEGKPKLSMIFGVSGNIINIILDYLFIFKFDMGMAGAALATGISVMIPFLLGVVYFVNRRSVYKFVKFKFDKEEFKRIIFNGFSEFIGQISFCITTYMFNYVIINRIGTDGVAAFTIVGYLSFIEYMILTGFAQGVNMLISYSYGAKDRESIMGILSLGLKSVAIVGIAAFLAGTAATDYLVKIFLADSPEVLNIAGIGMRIFSFAFLLNGYNFIASAYFTSLGDAKKSAAISILRSLFLISVFVFTLPLIFGDTGIWLVAPLTELVTFIVSYRFIRESKVKLSFS